MPTRARLRKQRIWRKNPGNVFFLLLLIKNEQPLDVRFLPLGTFALILFTCAVQKCVPTSFERVFCQFIFQWASLIFTGAYVRVRCRRFLSLPYPALSCFSDVQFLIFRSSYSCARVYSLYSSRRYFWFLAVMNPLEIIVKFRLLLIFYRNLYKFKEKYATIIVWNFIIWNTNDQN